MPFFYFTFASYNPYTAFVLEDFSYPSHSLYAPPLSMLYLSTLNGLNHVCEILKHIFYRCHPLLGAYFTSFYKTLRSCELFPIMTLLSD